MMCRVNSGTHVAAQGQNMHYNLAHDITSRDLTQLQHNTWHTAQGRIRRVPLAWMRRFQRGQETDVFRRYPQPSKAFQSFSIIYLHQ